MCDGASVVLVARRRVAALSCALHSTIFQTLNRVWGAIGGVRSTTFDDGVFAGQFYGHLRALTVLFQIVNNFTDLALAVVFRR